MPGSAGDSPGVPGSAGDSSGVPGSAGRFYVNGAVVRLARLGIHAVRLFRVLLSG